MSSPEYLGSDFSWPSSPIEITPTPYPSEVVSLDEIPDPEDEIEIETPVTDQSLLLSTNLSQTKGWVLGRAGFHGRITSTHLKQLQGVVVIPIREFTLLRDSRDFKHMVYFPLTSEDISNHPDLANLTQILQ